MDGSCNTCVYNNTGHRNCMFCDDPFSLWEPKDQLNPYWERITKMAISQRLKGIKTYGQGLEQFTTPDAIKRIEYIQEELIDGLMYLEWLKDILKGDTERGNNKET